MKFTKEIKIALVAVLGILVLFFGLNFLKGMTIFSNDNTYFVSFKDISGLSSSNPIYADVIQSGRKDYVASNTLVDAMKADNDPRLSKFFKPADGQWQLIIAADSFA